jgi:hypothetical protein
VDKGPYDRQCRSPEQYAPEAHVRSRVAEGQQADPLFEQWIGRYQQKHEDAAENDRNEPDGKPGPQRRQIECTDGIAEKSERADQIKLA